MPDRPIRTAQGHRGSLSKYLRRYQYQQTLTAHLDTLPNKPFSQDTVNEIVLWKVSRYVHLPKRLRDSLHALRVLSPRDHRQAEPVLLDLLDCHGIDLAMASTFLRFQNADVFQILDRHAYRAVLVSDFQSIRKRHPTPRYPSTSSTSIRSIHWRQHGAWRFATSTGFFTCSTRTTTGDSKNGRLVVCPLGFSTCPNGD
jgi:hypothetical protein